MGQTASLYYWFSTWNVLGTLISSQKAEETNEVLAEPKDTLRYNLAVTLSIVYRYRHRHEQYQYRHKLEHNQPNISDGKFFEL